MNRYIRDAILGAIGGVAGTFVIGKAMTAFADLQSEEDKQIEKSLTKQPPTEALAGRISEEIFDKKLTGEERATAGKVIQWGYGTLWGAVYGVMRNQYPVVSEAAGLPFGVSLALFGDALMLPLMKLLPPPNKFPLSTHANALASHYAYAATVEAVCSAAEVVEEEIFGPTRRTNPDLRRIS